MAQRCVQTAALQLSAAASPVHMAQPRQLLPGSRGAISFSHRKNYSLLLCNAHLSHISSTRNFCIQLQQKKKSSVNSTSTNLSVVTLLCNRDDSLTCCEWVNHGESAASARQWRSRKSFRLWEDRWEEAERLSGGRLAEREAGRRGSSFSPGRAALKFEPRLSEQRVDVELPSHKGNTSALYQILLPFHSSLPSAPSHSLFPRIEFAAAHIIFSKEIVFMWTNKYLICHCCLFLKG